MTRVAFVHDYLTQRGGAERVLLSMLRTFPGAPLYTSIYDPDGTFPEFSECDVRPMWINRLDALRTDHRRGLVLYPAAFSRLSVEAEVVVCSSSGFAHGVRTNGRKVVYCYTPPRWLYDQAAPYLRPLPAALRTAVRGLAPALRAWDRRAATSANTYLTTSSAVRKRIRAAYGIHAEVLAPATTLKAGGPQTPVAGCDSGFVLCVSRLLGYKNVDRVVAAFATLPHLRLVIVGDGPEAGRLRADAAANVRFVAKVDDDQLRWLYANCSMLAAASYEDFGLTPLEAAAFGKPSAVLRAGGYLDTVIDGVTGRFFDEPTPEAIAAAVSWLQARPLSPRPLLEHVQHYSEQAFMARLRRVVKVDQAGASEAAA